MSPRLRTAHMTGVSRTRERARSHPEDGVDALRETLRAFEKRCDPEDEEQTAALEKMRAETRRRERLDGTWERRGAPGVERDWLECAAERESAVKTTAAPMDDDDYAEYIKCVRWIASTLAIVTDRECRLTFLEIPRPAIGTARDETRRAEVRDVYSTLAHRAGTRKNLTKRTLRDYPRRDDAKLGSSHSKRVTNSERGTRR